MAKQKVLITGSCGFIFSNFVRLSIRDRHNFDLVSIDKVTRPEGLHNVYANRGHKFYIGDIADRHFVDTIFKLERPDIVINGAAESNVDDSINNTDPFIYSNVLGTQVIADKCIEYNVNRLIQISTDEVYGQMLKDDEPWTEDVCMAPRNPYSASKAASELIVKAAYETHGLEYNITRSCNNFGPRQSIKNLIPKVIKCISEDKPIPIYGQGSQMREWIHVADNYLALMAIIYDAPPNQTYNISAGYEITNLELVHEICNMMDKGHSLISFVKDRAGHDFRYAINSDNLRSLGWKPSFKFKAGLKHTIKWYLKNQWFMR